MPEKISLVYFGLAEKYYLEMIKSNGTVLHCNGGRTDGRAVFLCITRNFLRRRQDNTKSLVCIAGGQEWVQFWTILEQERKKEVQPCEEPKNKPWKD
ncbi:hypothetical protein M5E88_02420 [Akkermansia muciniphila]|nr:hypothetical protein M5E88_02420 [Akkermansia muciniphila]